MVHGLVFGKFYPFHRGHQYLMETAMKECDRVTIVVCSIPQEIIPGVLRHSWVNQTIRDLKLEGKYVDVEVDVIHFDKVVPQEPSEHPDFWRIWADLLNGLVKTRYDKLFTSEMYGFEMADHLDCEHVLVDLGRTTHDVSGTRCREYLTGRELSGDDPLWDELNTYYKKYLEILRRDVDVVDRFVVVGSESCGKSTMVENVSRSCNFNKVIEYGRTYTDKFEIRGIEDFYILLIEQLHRSLFGDDGKGFVRSVVVDTDALVTLAFAELYFPVRDKEFDEIVEWVMGYYKKYVKKYVLLSPTVGWVDDGTRMHREYRDFVNSYLKRKLDDYDIEYIEITDNDFNVRTNKVIEYLR